MWIGNTTKVIREFMVTLGRLRTIVELHLNSHIVIIGGDWNMDLFRSESGQRRETIKGMITELSLTLLSDG